MIWINFKNNSDNFSIVMPHEINNEFLSKVFLSMKGWNMKNYWFRLIFNDFWAPIEFNVDKLDKLYADFEILEQKLDEIIKIVPLPKMVWTFDWMLYVWFKNPMEFDNYVELWTWWWQYFDKEDMLYLIWLIKKKILEAKEKWETLVFSWD